MSSGLARFDPTSWVESNSDLASLRHGVSSMAAAARAKIASLRIYNPFPEIGPERTAYNPFPEIGPERTASQQVFEAIQSLDLSSNKPRDRKIADRITALHRDAIAEAESILPDSLRQFTAFFLKHRELGLPKVTLTPDGTLRARWIHGAGNFVAIEFTGQPLVKLVAEIPRGAGLTAQHFSRESANDIVSVAKSIGASFE
ncbi:MAG: hypothetical protein ACLQGP_10250 [Isosphaeraceae bacterium]